MRYLWLCVFFAVLAWSGYQPKDFPTWLLEVAPAIAGLAVLVRTRETFPLTSLVYGLILLHCVVLMVGGHYTYAEVPLFDWIRDVTGGDRNNYDKVGHFVQGFVPAMIAREIIIRKHLVNGEFWVSFFSVCFCLAFSAFYELIEWWVALLSGSNAEAFLGTQGYVWDTQSDMALALLGALIAIISLKNWHDRLLREMENIHSVLTPA